MRWWVAPDRRRTVDAGTTSNRAALANGAEVFVDTLAGQASTSTGNRAALAHEAEVYVDTLAERARAAH